MRTSGFAVALSLGVLAAGRAASQTSYEACYVPTVGAIYLIKQTGLPSACLAAAHTGFSWTTGAIADGSVTTAKLADGSVTEAKLSFDPATQGELNAAVGRVSGYQIVMVSDTIAPGERSSTFATCPAGKAAVGGGFFAEIIHVEQSIPLYGVGPGGVGASGSSWAVRFYNDRAGAAQVLAYAVCVNTS